MNLPTQNVSTRVRIGSAMQAAKLGIAIANICWYNCLLLPSLFLSLVISIDDSDNDVLDNDDLDNDDLDNNDLDNDDLDNDDVDNDDVDNDEDNVSSDDINNTITTLW